MKKRLLVIVLCLAMISLTMAGCGSSAAGDSQNSQGASSGASSTAATKSGEEITLTVMSTLITETEAPLEQAMADAYMKEHSNVKIKFLEQPVNEMAKKIIALNTSDDLPDAFFMPTEFMAQAHDMGIIVDHEKLLGQEFISTLNEKVVEFGKIEGQLMLVPWHVIPVALIARADWMKDAGIDKIETVADFRAAAKAFTKDKHWGFSMVGTKNGSGEARFCQFIRTFGVNEVYKDASGKWVSDLTTDKYKKALQTFVDLSKKDGVVPPGVTETGYPEAVAYFAKEQTGLMISGSNAIGAIESANPALKGKLVSIPMPADERHVTNLQTSGYAITTACKNPEAMADYLKFMTSKDIAVDFATKSGRLPVTKEAISAPELQTDSFKGFLDCMQYALPQPSFPAYTEILDIMGDSYNTMLATNRTIDEIMKTVETRLKSVLEANN